jgi:plasmid stability protein
MKRKLSPKVRAHAWKLARAAWEGHHLSTGDLARAIERAVLAAEKRGYRDGLAAALPKARRRRTSEGA